MCIRDRPYLSPLLDPDSSLLPPTPLGAFSPPPPPPFPRHDGRVIPQGWSPPSWPSRPPSQRYPLFAVTSWSFPSASLAAQFYWSQEVRFEVRSLTGSQDRLRRLGRRWAALLADACPSPLVGKRVRSLVRSSDAFEVPVVLHRVMVAGRPMWILLSASAYATDPLSSDYRLYLDNAYMLLPWSGESLYEENWVE